ncbi:ATP-binding cassette domain-containing protein [Cohnella laeviribosi]|uniref:ATP-binding cassette domain-containing protein n=1 Tax=Cohnella laeviribosi TaxID=380174 RepID=UPI00036DF4FD|nr:ATP-binding cassette domain-containing protein [Cohnella laeviribosi]
MTQPLRIALREASKRFNKHTVLFPLTLEVRQGETIALVGKNGSGKSTLLKMLAGLSRLSGHGQICLYGGFAVVGDRLDDVRLHGGGK